MRIPKILVATLISLLLTVMLVTPAFADGVSGTCEGYSCSGYASCLFALNGGNATTIVSGRTADVEVYLTVRSWDRTYTWYYYDANSYNEMDSYYVTTQAYAKNGYRLDCAKSSHIVTIASTVWRDSIPWFAAS